LLRPAITGSFDLTDTTHTDTLPRTSDTTRRTIVLSLIAAAAGLAAPRPARAFYDDRIGQGAGARPRAASSNVAVVDMNNGLQFVPEEVRIKVGDTVEWRNVESFPHSVTADPALAVNPDNVRLPAGAKPFNSGRIDGGKSWRHTFTVAGVYHYFCIPHEGRGMLGSVVVG
jgi:plastocyanin